MGYVLDTTSLSWQWVVFIFKFLGIVIGGYLILQRFHMRIQMRFLKNISDEIIKINDFCIELSFKYLQYQKSFIDTPEKGDIKILTEILTIRSKINNHLDYLSAQIVAFPFGNPINFLWYSIKSEYLWRKVQIKTDEYLTNYQDKVGTEFILQLEIPWNPDNTVVSNQENSEENDQEKCNARQEKIDEIVVAGLDLINFIRLPS